MSLNQLKNLLIPPADPRATDGSWADVEAALGFELPKDYKMFISAYGDGRIDGYMSVLNPFSSNQYLNLLTCGGQLKAALQMLCDSYGEDIRYADLIDSERLVPWAVTSNADFVLWVRDGDFVQHRVLVGDSAALDWDDFPCATSEFLVGVLTGGIRVSVFPENCPKEKHQFKPY